MLVPTMPRPYTVAEVARRSVHAQFAARDLHQFRQSARSRAIAVPSGMRADGLPSSVTLIAPAGADGLLAGIRRAIQARSGAPMGATGRRRRRAPRRRARRRRPHRDRRRRRASLRPAAQPRTRRARRRFRARGRNDARLSAVRASRHDAAETRIAARRRRRGRAIKPNSGRSTPPASALLSRDSRPARRSARCALPTAHSARASWSRRRRSRALKIFRVSAAGGPISPRADEPPGEPRPLPLFQPSLAPDV